MACGDWRPLQGEQEALKSICESRLFVGAVGVANLDWQGVEGPVQPVRHGDTIRHQMRGMKGDATIVTTMNLDRIEVHRKWGEACAEFRQARHELRYPRAAERLLYCVARP